MNIFNLAKKVNAIRFAIVLILVGLAFTVISGIVLAQPEKETAKVEATITDIQVIENGEDTEYHVTVSYEVDGKAYENEIGAYTSGWKVGDVLECNYDAEDPSVISYGNSRTVILVVLVVGVAALVAGIVLLVKNVKKSVKDYAQYNKVDEKAVDPAKKAEIEANTEAPQDYVFHYTGKLNQSYVMKDAFGTEVFRADCGGIKLVGDTDYEFVNSALASRTQRKIGHAVTVTDNSAPLWFPSVSSAFRIDGKNCWNFLAEQGYGFEFSLNGLRPHYNVKHYGVPVGTVDAAGTEILKEQPTGNPLAKIPTQGLYRISCRPSEAEGIFYICFCLTKTDNSLS